MAFGIMNRPAADWGSCFLLGATFGAVALLLFLVLQTEIRRKRDFLPSFPESWGELPGKPD